MEDFITQVCATVHGLPLINTPGGNLAIAWRTFEDSNISWSSKTPALDIYLQKTYCRWVYSELEDTNYYTHVFSEYIFQNFRQMYMEFCDLIMHTPGSRSKLEIPLPLPRQISYIPGLHHTEEHIETACQELINTTVY